MTGKIYWKNRYCLGFLTLVILFSTHSYNACYVQCFRSISNFRFLLQSFRYHSIIYETRVQCVINRAKIKCEKWKKVFFCQEYYFLLEHLNFNWNWLVSLGLFIDVENHECSLYIFDTIQIKKGKIFFASSHPHQLQRLHSKSHHTYMLSRATFLALL